MTKKHTPPQYKPKSRFRLLVKLLITLVLLVTAWAIYLDAQIRHRFEGNPWAVPAQIFARPLVIERDMEITPKEIMDELELLSYRKVSRLGMTGEYQYRKDEMRISRRAFVFPEGPEPERELRIRWQDGRIASIEDSVLKQPLDEVRLEPWLISRLVSADREDRMLVSLDDVPTLLPAALLLVEDKDFYSHQGVAPLSILRALLVNIRAGRTVQGGSTLTQQLVKNLFLTQERSLARKAKEAVMALIIDARYSKDDILQAYLNEVYLGQAADTAIHGFGLASLFYFERPLAELRVQEMATLVAMVKGASYYNPRRYPDRVQERRDLVLRLMFEAALLTRSDYERAISQPMEIAPGSAFVKGKHPAFMQRVSQELQHIVVAPSLRDAGVRVFTSMDVNAQRRAEHAMVQSAEKLQSKAKAPLQGAMLVTDIASGEIRAIVSDVAPSYAGFNRALNANRPIGSLIKPVVYATALEFASEYWLATVLDDKPLSIPLDEGTSWQPKNYDGKTSGQVLLVDALAKSLNLPTVHLGMSLGLETVSDTLYRLTNKSMVLRHPSSLLGAISMTPIDVSQMYQTIANEGSYAELHTVTAVTNLDYELLWQRPSTQEQRMDTQSAYLLNFALFKATREGTAKQLGAKFPRINMAGKTGTTDDYRDSWFAGFDRQHLVTVWLGNDDNQPIGLSGATGALPVFMAYQQQQEPKSLSRRLPAGIDIAHFYIEDGAPVKAGSCAQVISVPAVVAALPAERNGCLGTSEKAPTTTSKRPWWKQLFGGSK